MLILQELILVSYGTSIITVKVGRKENSKTFTVHENLLTKYSDFFRTALNGQWAESKTNSVLLPQHNPESFSIFTQYLYDGQIYSAKDDEDDRVTAGADWEWLRLLEAWRLGDSLLAPSFNDAIVDVVIAKIHQSYRYPIGMVKHTHYFGGKSAGLRRLSLDIAIWVWEDEDYDTQLNDVPHEFLVDLAEALGKTREAGRKGEDPLENAGCRYHDHVAEGKPCYETMF